MYKQSLMHVTPQFWVNKYLLKNNVIAVLDTAIHEKDPRVKPEDDIVRCGLFKGVFYEKPSF